MQVGCEDGTVKVFEILDERIQFQRNLDRQKGERGREAGQRLHASLRRRFASCCVLLLGRIISLSWHSSGTLIAAGMMDAIRIFDASTGEDAS